MMLPFVCHYIAVVRHAVTIRLLLAIAATLSDAAFIFAQPCCYAAEAYA